MHVGRDEDDLEAPTQWNIAQFALACIGTMSITTFNKYPLYQYYGSGWGILCFVFYLLTGAGAILYLQLRVSCEHRRSQISLFSKYLPFTKAISIAFMMRNLIQVVQVSSLMTHMLSYIMFGLYRCDGHVCVGSLYMWSTCYDTWNTPQCNNAELQVRFGPTPEDQFLQNYVLDHVLTWDSSSPSFTGSGGSVNSPALLGSFPTWLNIYALEQTLLVASWLAISLCVAFGPRVFGLMLYGVAPVALGAFLVVFIYGFSVLAQYPYINNIFYKLYGQMFTIMPLLTTQVDPFYYQPLEWGILGSMVCMTQALQLWSGQWSSMAKWVGYGRRVRHVLPIIVIVIFGLIGHLPTILACAFLSAGYEINYLRFHLIKPYALFFIIFPRIFGMWGVHPAIMVLWFSATFLLALISNSLLILTTVDNIVDDLKRYSRRADRAPEKARRWTTGIICVVLYLLCQVLITRAGIFFIVAIDYYIDLLLFALIPFAGAAYFIVYLRTETVGGVKVRRTEKTIIAVLYFFGLIVSLAAFIDLLVYFVLNTSVPSYDGVQFPQSLTIIGWLIAASPIIIGFMLGIPLSLRETEGSCGERCAQLSNGYVSEEYQNQANDTVSQQTVESKA